MASMGMWGAIGGVGKALSDQSAFLARQEEADLQVGRQKDLQGWLLAKQDEFAVAREGRANAESDRRAERDDQRDIAKDERTWTNEQARAPVKREMKAKDITSEHNTKSEAAAGTARVDAATKKLQTEAGISDADRRVKESQADYYGANADYVRGAKTEAAGGKPDALVVEQVKSLNDQIEKGEQKWQEGVLNGTIVKQADGQLGTPEQREVRRRMSMLVQQRDDLLRSRGRSGGGGTPGPDPIERGQRKPDGTTPDGKPYIMTSGKKDEPAPQEGMVGKFDTSDPGLWQGINDIKDPQERANARAALVNQTAPMRPAGAPAPAAPAAPAQPAPGAAPAQPVDPANPLAVMRRRNQLLDERNAKVRAAGPTPEEDAELQRTEREGREAWLKGDDAGRVRAQEAASRLRAKIQARQESARRAT